MYLVCRHIKPNGQRCLSPAMCGHAFCYFHARVHTRTSITALSDLRFPLPEDNAAIQESLGKVFDAIVNSRIGPKESAQILWGLQIAVQTIARNPESDPESIDTVIHTADGDEMAQLARVCRSSESCCDCNYAKDCPDYDPDYDPDDNDEDEDE